MGNRVNLCLMLGLPGDFTCPKCRAWIPTGFRSYDIECGIPNPELGLWILNSYCNHCDVSRVSRYRVKVVFEGEDYGI